MTFAEWTLLLGLLLLTTVFAGVPLDRVSLTSAMVHLLPGWLLGPAALNVLTPDPCADTALLISLFAVGLRLVLHGLTAGPLMRLYLLCGKNVVARPVPH